MSKLNIVIATHGKFGEELVKSAEMIVGKIDNIRCVSLLPGMSFEEFLNEAESVLKDLDGPVLALVDLYGGTPSNVFSALTRKYHHDVITGVNLPMLIDLYLNFKKNEEINMENLIKSCIDCLKSCGVHTNAMLK